MADRITSIRNERIKYIRSLGRRRVRQREGRFLVEGTRLLAEAVRAGIKPALVLYTEAWAANPEARALLPTLNLAEEGAWVVSERVLGTCAQTESPQGVIAAVPYLHLSPRSGLVLVLDRLRDPGNLGTILRSAEAAGVGEVALAPGTVDPFNPKVVRAAMGAHFHVPVTHLEWSAIRERLVGRAVWLADVRGRIPHDQVDWTVPSALIVGGETTGTSEDAAELAAGRVRIPMTDSVESLNAAMAVTVILFEAARQRRTGAKQEAW